MEKDFQTARSRGESGGAAGRDFMPDLRFHRRTGWNAAARPRGSGPSLRLYRRNEPHSSGRPEPDAPQPSRSLAAAQRPEQGLSIRRQVAHQKGPSKCQSMDGHCTDDARGRLCSDRETALPVGTKAEFLNPIRGFAQRFDGCSHRQRSVGLDPDPVPAAMQPCR